MADWLIEALFVDDVCRRAFLAVAGAGGQVEAALVAADPEARELIERASVADLDAEPRAEALNLINAAVRRELARRVTVADPDTMREDIEARRGLEEMYGGEGAEAAIDQLLTWLMRRTEERS